MIAWRRAPAPPGYLREWHGGDRELVVDRELAPALRQALAEGTLYDYAAHHPAQRLLQGRGAAYAVPLPEGAGQVVVRRSRHGGMLAALRGDAFLIPTRAPHELDVSLRLRRSGVPTPELLAYATYPAGGPMRRADIVTREIESGEDLGALLRRTSPGAERDDAWRATGLLLAQMAAAGARHPDLNVANVLLAPDEAGTLEAWVLDVDRVWFDATGDPRVMAANLRRLDRSVRKRRDREGVDIGEGELAALATLAGDATA